LVLVILYNVDDIFWRDKESETLKESPLSLYHVMHYPDLIA
jgi:hypothetical protein